MTTTMIIAAIIVVAAIILYSTKVPIALTSLGAMVAMYLTGVLSASQALTGFSSSVTQITVGMSFVTGAFFATGLAEFIGSRLYKVSHGKPKVFLAAVFIVTAVCSCFMSGSLVIILFMPLIDSVAQSSNGTISRKMMFMPMGVAALLGGNLTLTGATSCLAVSGMLEQTDYGQPFSYFEPLKVAGLAVLVALIYYLTVGWKIQEKAFDFEENAPVNNVDASSIPEKMTTKMWIVAVVLVACVCCFIWTDLSIPLVAMTGALILVITKCCTIDECIQSVNWTTIVILIGILGFAKGVEVSGLGTFIAEGVANAGQSIGMGPWGLCVIMLLVTSIMSEFMSNNAACVIMFPISYGIATILGASPLAFAIAVSVGANTAVCTPICATTMTLLVPVGYRFKDYIKSAGPCSLLVWACCALMLKVFYF